MRNPSASSSHKPLSERELVFLCNVLDIDHRAMNEATMLASIEHLFSPAARHPHSLGPIPRIAIHPYRASFAKLFPGMPKSSDNIRFPKETLWQLAKLECINEKCFDWIDIRNNRMCNYLWSTIRIANSYIFQRFDIKFMDIFKEPTFDFDSIMPMYEYFKYLDRQPRKNDLKIKAFKGFIDILDEPPELKMNIVLSMKDAWFLCTGYNDMLAWFGDMRSADCMKKCHWAWDYICKKFKITSTNWLINNDNKNDLYSGLITAFDLSLCDTFARNDLKEKMKKGWTQKNYRDNGNEKKGVSIVLPKNTIKMLSMISVETNEGNKEILSRLVKDEYNKIKSGKR